MSAGCRGQGDDKQNPLKVRKTIKPAFCLTVADFFNAPSVDEVDLSGYSGQPGDLIVIRASDDFEVADVGVVLSQADGSPIEKGAAVETPAHSSRWVYTASVEVETGTTVQVMVTAMDRPGNRTVKTATKN